MPDRTYAYSIGVDPNFKQIRSRIDQSLKEISETYSLNNRRSFSRVDKKSTIPEFEDYRVADLLQAYCDGLDDCVEKHLKGIDENPIPKLIVVAGGIESGKTLLIRYVLRTAYFERDGVKEYGFGYSSEEEDGRSYSYPRIAAINAAQWNGQDNFKSFLYGVLRARFLQEDFEPLRKRFKRCISHLFENTGGGPNGSVGYQFSLAEASQYFLDKVGFVEHILAYLQAEGAWVPEFCQLEPSERYPGRLDNCNLLSLVLDNVDIYGHDTQVEILSSLNNLLECVESLVPKYTQVLYEMSNDFGQGDGFQKFKSSKTNTPFCRIILALKKGDSERIFSPNEIDKRNSRPEKEINLVFIRNKYNTDKFFSKIPEKTEIRPCLISIDDAISFDFSFEIKGGVEGEIGDLYGNRFEEWRNTLVSCLEETVRDLNEDMSIDQNSSVVFRNDKKDRLIYMAKRAIKFYLVEFFQWAKLEWRKPQYRPVLGKKFYDMSIDMTGRTWRSQFVCAKKILSHPSVLRVFYIEYAADQGGDRSRLIEYNNIHYIWFALTDFLQPDLEGGRYLLTTENGVGEEGGFPQYGRALVLNLFFILRDIDRQMRNPLIGIYAVHFLVDQTTSSIFSTEAFVGFLREMGYEEEAILDTLRALEEHRIVSPYGPEVVPETGDDNSKLYKNYEIVEQAMTSYYKLIHFQMDIDDGEVSRNDNLRISEIYHFNCAREIYYSEKGGLNKSDQSSRHFKSVEAKKKKGEIFAKLKGREFLRYSDVCARACVLIGFTRRIIEANRRLEARIITTTRSVRSVQSPRRPCLVRNIVRNIYHHTKKEIEDYLGFMEKLEDKEREKIFISEMFSYLESLEPQICDLPYVLLGSEK